MPEGLPQAKPTVTSVTVTILAGQSVSNAADLTTGSLAMMFTPPDWDAGAHLTFQVSEDNVTYRDLFDRDGNEIVRAMGINRAVNIDTALTNAALWLKLRSGLRDAPIAQSADRVFVLALV